MTTLVIDTSPASMKLKPNARVPAGTFDVLKTVAVEANQPDLTPVVDLDTVANELRQIDPAFDGDATTITTRSLVHNPLNMVTDELATIDWPGGSAVRKVVTADGSGSAHWRASQDPRHWNYWRREVDVYRSDLPGRLGLGAPALLGSLDWANSASVSLWLERVDGLSGNDWTVETLAHAGRALGAAQGAAEFPDEPWLSRNYIDQYGADKPADYSLLDDDETWRHPYVSDAWSDDLRAGFRLLRDRRERFLEIMTSLPRVVAHLDAWPNNMVLRPDNEVAFLDWSFTGDGTLGEDIGNLIPDGVLDLLVPADRMADVERVVFEAYLEGLDSVDWRGDPELVRLGMYASAIKYVWLVPLLLGRLDEPVHYAYGNETDPFALYADRGVALQRLAEWAQLALPLADRLGF